MHNGALFIRKNKELNTKRFHLLLNISSSSSFCRNGTAIGGDEEDLCHHKCDYQRIEEGVLHFASGETSKDISIRVDSTADVRILHFFFFIFYYYENFVMMVTRIFDR